MKTYQDGVRTLFAELTEDEWQRGLAWLEDKLLNREVWEDDHSKIVIHDGSLEDLNALAAEMAGAG